MTCVYFLLFLFLPGWSGWKSSSRGLRSTCTPIWRQANACGIRRPAFTCKFSHFQQQTLCMCAYCSLVIADSCSILLHWLLFFLTSFKTGQIGNNKQIKRVLISFFLPPFLGRTLYFVWFVTHAGSGRLTANGGSFLTTRRRDFITTTPRRNAPCGTGQTTATSSLWPNYRYVPAKALSSLASFFGVLDIGQWNWKRRRISHVSRGIFVSFFNKGRSDN